MLMPTSPGIVVHKNTNASIDHSNASEGYITVKYYSDPNKRCKLNIKSGGHAQNFDVPSDGTPKVYPLCFEDGIYTISVFRQIKDTRYETIAILTINVVLRDFRAPFLYPNTYCTFTPASDCVRIAADICRNTKTDADRLGIIYRWIIDNVEYDRELAKKIITGEIKWWLPDPDGVIAAKKSICFGYASLFAAMCRSQGIPCKIAVGRVNGQGLHAWNSVYSETSGVFDKIPIKAKAWTRIDVTFMDTSRGQAADFVLKDDNYPVEYHG